MSLSIDTERIVGAWLLLGPEGTWSKMQMGLGVILASALLGLGALLAGLFTLASLRRDGLPRPVRAARGCGAALGLLLGCMFGLRVASDVYGMNPWPGGGDMEILLGSWDVLMLGLSIAVGGVVWGLLRSESRAVEYVLATRRQVGEATRRADQDSMTGLLNHGALFRLAQARVAGMGTEPLGVIMLDVDELKAVNDRYGHLTGDELIRSVAEVIRGCVRADDLAARYGGDEFVVVVSGLSLEETLGCAQRLLDKVGGAEINAPRLSITLGVAWGHANRCSFAEFIQVADRAMYGAKEKQGASLGWVDLNRRTHEPR